MYSLLYIRSLTTTTVDRAPCLCVRVSVIRKGGDKDRRNSSRRRWSESNLRQLVERKPHLLDAIERK